MISPQIKKPLVWLLLLFLVSCSSNNGSVGVGDGDWSDTLDKGEENTSSSDMDLDEKAYDWDESLDTIDVDETEEVEENVDSPDDDPMSDRDGEDLPGDGDPLNDEDTDIEDVEENETDRESDEETIDQTEEDELLDPHPLTGLCTPPLPRVARWLLDFPRVPTGSETGTVQSLADNMVAISGNHVSLFPEDDDPVTYYPPVGRYYNIYQAPSGVWFANSERGVWHYRGLGEDWEKVNNDIARGVFLLVDAEGVFWLSIYAQPNIPLFRWDGTSGRSIPIQGSDETWDSEVRASTLCNGRKYFFGGLRDDDRNGGSTIFLLNEEETELIPIWQSPNRGGTFLSTSIAPDGCDFLAAGYRIWVEGTLGNPPTINVYQTDTSFGGGSLGYIAHMDWETGTRFSCSPVNCNGEESILPFARLSDDLSSCDDIGPSWTFSYDLGYEAWVQRQMGGPNLDQLFVAASVVPFRYRPEEDRFVVAYEHPLLQPPGFMALTQVRSLALHEGEDGRYRLHATGPALPVMRRTGCHEWEEGAQDSEWVYKLYDTGSRLLGVGDNSQVMVLDPQAHTAVEVQGGGWVKGRDIVEDVTGETYVIGEPIENSNRLHCSLYYKSTSVEDTATNWVEIPAPEGFDYWNPTFLDRSRTGPIVLVASIDLEDVNSIPTGDSVVYRLKEGQLTEIARSDSDAALHVHGEDYILSSCNGAWSMDPHTGVLHQEITQLVTEQGELAGCLYDAVKVEESRWVVASRYLYEYDALTQEYSTPLTAWTGLGGVYPTGNIADDYTLYRKTFYTLIKLPTGEVLAGATEGRIFRRLTDGQWYLGEE